MLTTQKNLKDGNPFYRTSLLCLLDDAFSFEQTRSTCLNAEGGTRLITRMWHG